MLSDEEFNAKQDDWGSCNFVDAALGYAIKAMYWCGLDRQAISETVKHMKYFLETDSVEDAEVYYAKSGYKGISLISDE